MNVHGSPPRLVQADEVEQALQWILQPGQVTELRALDATTNGDRYPQTLTGYFDDPGALLAALAAIRTAKGIYLIPNPVNPALLARAHNRIRKSGRGESTADADIIGRHWLLVDCDPQRPSGISATDCEHDAAAARMRTIDAHLKQCGWPEPILADSGNGAHLLYRIDLPVDEAALVQRCLVALAQWFDDDRVKIDQKVFNPARIWKLYGTAACKGDHTAERPHRMSRILSAPEHLQVVSLELLETLAAEAASSIEPASSVVAGSQLASFDIDAFIQRHAFEVDGPHVYQGGRKWTFKKSPMCDHHGDGPFLIQFANGALNAGCHHNSCSWTWRDLRVKYEQPRHVLNGFANNTCNRTLSGTKTSPTQAVEAYKPFPVEILPSVVSAYVAAAAAAIGCDASFIALPILASLARAIGNKRAIRLKRSWTEPAIVWAAIIGKSGTHKTPAIQAAMQFLQRKQAEAIAGHTEALARYEEERAIYDRDYAAWKRVRKDVTEPPPWPPQEPVCQRYVTTDTTIEALASLLAAQFDGILVTRDELAGWLGGIAEYKGGKGSDLGHWLASWSAAPLTVDRKTGAVKMLHVPRASVSIVGGIQPGILRTAIGQEHLQDGLCARLLVAMPEPKPVRWSEAIIDPHVEAALADAFDRLLSLEPAADEDGHPAPFALSLSPDAKVVWVNYYNRHRAELTDLDDDLAAAWSKLEAYAARFALIFQLCSWAAGEQFASGETIDEAAMQSAITLADWFGDEARRVYGMFAETDADREYRELVEFVRRRGGRITPRELARSCRRYRANGEAEAALEELVKGAIGRWEITSSGPRGGKPARIFMLGKRGDGAITHANTVNGEVMAPSSVSPLRNGRSSNAADQLLTEHCKTDETSHREL